MQNIPSNMGRTTAVLALILVGGTMGFLAASLVPALAVQDARLSAVLQFVTPPLMLVLGWFFGSSKQGERAAELAAISPPPPDTTHPAAPDGARLDDMQRRLATMAPGPERDKLAGDVAALKAKIAGAA